MGCAKHMLSQEEVETFDRALNPHGVAVVGATNQPERVGYCVLESLLLGGIEGPIYPIHPRNKEVLGQRVYPSLAEVDGPIDLAIIALNQYATVDMVEECGQRGVKGVVCMAGGYKEMGEEGLALERRLAAVARQYKMALFGPNTLGIFNSRANLNATFWPIKIDNAQQSAISVISQSGGVGQMIVTKAMDEGVTINKWIGVGNRATLEVVDCLQYLAGDETTKVIAVFIEGIERARDFVELAAEVARHKPVIVFKAGTSGLAQQCALTHTGSMAGKPKMYQDIFEQFNLLVVDSVSQLVSACKALSLSPPAAGNRIGLFTPTAGPSIVMVDELDRLGCRLEPFTNKTRDRLDVIFQDVAVVVKNPLDAALIGYSADSYAQVAEIVLQDPNVDILIAINTEHKNRRFPVRELVSAQRAVAKPIIVCHIATQAGRDIYLEQFQSAGIPIYSDVAEAAWGAAALAQYATNTTKVEHLG